MDFSTSKIIDWDLGIQLIGSREAAAEMLTDLVAEIPMFQEQLSKAWLQNNREKLYSLSHTLHGVTCYCGTPRLKEISKAFEIALLNSEPESTVKELYKMLFEEMRFVMDAFVST
jgi:two-component system sensor histidine kinase BarA